jgi:hypothetical protein
MRIPVALGAVAVLSACASSPDDISTAYVSELQYKDYSCEQVEMERTRVSQRADDLHASLKKTADNDTAQMAVGMILFFPVLFFLEGGDGPEAQEYSRLKGEAQALEKVAITKSCNLAPLPQPEYQVRQGGGLPDEEPQSCCPTKGEVARSINAPDGGQDESDLTYNASPQGSLNGLWAGTERPESGSCRMSSIGIGKIESVHFELIVREPEISGRVTKAHHNYKSLVNVDASGRGIVSESGEFNLRFGVSELGAEIVLQGRLSNESNRASGKWSTPNCQGTLSLTRKSPY